MEKTKILTAILVLCMALMLVACQPADTDADDDIDSDTVTADDDAADDTADDATDDSTADDDAAADDTADDGECEDECEEVGQGFCEKDAFYVCIEKDGCKQAKLLEKCGGDYYCEEKNICSSDSTYVKLGIVRVAFIDEYIPGMSGEVGDEFGFSTDKYTNLLCLVDDVKEGQALLKCR
ncbi:hypothetical protein ACFL96_03160 [Thermoproteota archaeon]